MTFFLILLLLLMGYGLAYSIYTGQKGLGIVLSFVGLVVMVVMVEGYHFNQGTVIGYALVCVLGSLLFLFYKDSSPAQVQGVVPGAPSFDDNNWGYNEYMKNAQLLLEQDNEEARLGAWESLAKTFESHVPSLVPVSRQQEQCEWLLTEHGELYQRCVDDLQHPNVEVQRQASKAILRIEAWLKRCGQEDRSLAWEALLTQWNAMERGAEAYLVAEVLTHWLSSQPSVLDTFVEAYADPLPEKNRSMLKAMFQDGVFEEHWGAINPTFWGVYSKGTMEQKADLLPFFPEREHSSTWYLGEPWESGLVGEWRQKEASQAWKDAFSRLVFLGYLPLQSVHTWIPQLHEYFVAQAGTSRLFKSLERWAWQLGRGEFFPETRALLESLLETGDAEQVGFAIEVMCEQGKQANDLLPLVWEALKAPPSRYRDDGLRVHWERELKSLAHAFGEEIAESLEELYDTPEQKRLNQRTILSIFAPWGYKPERFVPELIAFLREPTTRPPSRLEDHMEGNAEYVEHMPSEQLEHYYQLWEKWRTSFREEHKHLSQREQDERLEELQAEPAGSFAASTLWLYGEAIRPYSKTIKELLDNKEGRERLDYLRSYLNGR